MLGKDCPNRFRRFGAWSLPVLDMLRVVLVLPPLPLVVLVPLGKPAPVTALFVGHRQSISFFLLSLVRCHDDWRFNDLFSWTTRKQLVLARGYAVRLSY